MKTAVIILNFNGRGLMEQYLPSVLANSLEGEVIVADNGSTDDSVAWLRATYPALTLLAFDRNYGFAEGYNRAIRAVEADYIVLLNSDVETPAGWLGPLVGMMDSHPECAACQPKILAYKDKTAFEYAGAAGGFIDRYGYPFCRGRMMSHLEQDNGQYDSDLEIFWATGACMMVRRSVYLACGGLDATFFAHQEEIDLCWRMKARGHSIKCVGRSLVYHLGGGSLGYESPRKTFLNFRNNAIMLYKNLPDREYRRVAFVRFWLDAAAALQMLLTGSPASARAVVRAKREFRSLKKNYKEAREQNLSLTTQQNIEGRLNLLLLAEVYIHKRRKFADLQAADQVK